MIMTHYNIFLSTRRCSWDPGRDQNRLSEFGPNVHGPPPPTRPSGAMRTDVPGNVHFGGLDGDGPWATLSLFQTGRLTKDNLWLIGSTLTTSSWSWRLVIGHALDRTTAVSLYLAPSGEPAWGRPLSWHRTSAMDNPAAPISHHWMDSTHISFGLPRWA